MLLSGEKVATIERFFELLSVLLLDLKKNCRTKERHPKIKWSMISNFTKTTTKITILDKLFTRKFFLYFRFSICITTSGAGVFMKCCTLMVDTFPWKIAINTAWKVFVFGVFLVVFSHIRAEYREILSVNHAKIKDFLKFFSLP